MSFPIPFKICLDQSMINANMQVPQIMDKVQIACWLPINFVKATTGFTQEAGIKLKLLVLLA